MQGILRIVLTKLAIEVKQASCRKRCKFEVLIFLLIELLELRLIGFEVNLSDAAPAARLA
ncbi:MAG: hypothetical protein AUJ20_02130 [Comamonadaceae bacterium CG1_02_60_18]|nr:MAG: hypothetical protein AUJ20_02130 [Comamonadaceae bacterium CG1_02_60_18]PIQ53994.1 MAG: hypothetical protein COW02_05695 [Comamonadaceae bacterium CG12_big_fil_rev_8_21_14_0_65_59_15]